MTECRQCHGTGYMTVRDGSTDRVKPCNLCLVGSARYWEEKQKDADERKRRAAQPRAMPQWAEALAVAILDSEEGKASG